MARAFPFRETVEHKAKPKQAESNGFIIKRSLPFSLIFANKLQYAPHRKRSQALGGEKSKVESAAAFCDKIQALLEGLLIFQMASPNEAFAKRITLLMRV
ncbi:MAG: hypothetical protein AAF723_09045 [Pseudomonadota bacterium]